MNNEPNIKTREEILNLFNLKRFNELIKKILKLQKIYSKSIFLLNVQGTIYNELENYEDAIDSFNKTITINPNFADGFYNLGIIYKKINALDKSIIHYDKCLKINPDKFEAYNNLANIYKDQNKNGLAIENYINCLEINPNYLIALQNFAVCLQNFKFTKYSYKAEKHIINLLEKNKILRPVDIIISLLSYLYANSEFNNMIKNYEELDNIKTFENFLKNFLEFKILIKLLEITPITDIKIEKMLRKIRLKFLLNISKFKNKNIATQIIRAIASQCFINEYIYPISKKEEELLYKLEMKIKNNIKKNIKKMYLEIACLAAYKPLYKYKWSNKIINIKEISFVINQQITDPLKEKHIKKEISVKKIKNIISKKVKDQYESNPYPRWEKISLYKNPKKPLNFFRNLNLNINEKNIEKWKNIDVLVAGCGTGQHAITTATKYENSHVTAIDLSANSLSFAKRKADELNIKNIDFIQMDLLDLKKNKKKYNIIESVGVLHHMSNPFEGWNILNEALQPNGLIMIGLYSKSARKHIERIRSKLNKMKVEVNNKSIINFREEIIEHNIDDYKLIKESPDFYSLSNLRDLLFHVQEHRFTIPEIKEYLKRMKLKFCGFENETIINLFKKSYKNFNDLYDLDLWNNFEYNNPRVFAGMYQFWCQKNESFEI